MTTSNKPEITNAHHAALVDALAATKARIAALQAEEAALKDALIALATPTVALLGTEHRAVVSLVDGRMTTDWQTIARKLNASRQMITAHTTQGEAYYTVRLYAHKTA
jgi:hypothetical protein